MRIVRGLEDARKVLCEGRGLGLDDVPQSLLEGIADLFGEALTPLQVVERIVRRVRAEGDAAVREYSELLDGAAPGAFEVPRSAIAEARGQASADVVDALEAAAARIHSFHEACLSRGWTDYGEGYGQIVNAVGSAGAYIPGGNGAVSFDGADDGDSGEGGGCPTGGDVYANEGWGTAASGGAGGGGYRRRR